MSNFSFLDGCPRYAVFAPTAIRAEELYAESPADCAINCRKALELAVKWLYHASSTLKMPPGGNLSGLIHNAAFRALVNSEVWNGLPLIVKLGNLAVHSGKAVTPAEAAAVLRGLFGFVVWIDYAYGDSYRPRTFDEAALPKPQKTFSAAQVRAYAQKQKKLLDEKDAKIAWLLEQVAAHKKELEAAAKRNTASAARILPGDGMSEFATRKVYIDVDLKELGWRFDGPDKNVFEEYELDGMAGVPGQKGFADYVLFGGDGRPLAVIEAKRTSADPNKGREQAVLYAGCLERRFGRRPITFTSNGFETFYWDDVSGPQRRVSGFFTSAELEKRIARRGSRRDLNGVGIDMKITDRYYQIAAVKAVCDRFTAKFRKALLVMATGTGKTRTAASLTDVLTRGGWATNVLFLADRTALVSQAKFDFQKYLPDMSLCNLCSNKDDSSARIVFSTYPTMLNAIDSARGADGARLFTPAHFDLIIIDEAHRSIFKKYRAIFDYFDACLVGLTATPKTDVDRNTYEFFELGNGIPTYAYDYQTAVEKDHYLVPYRNIEVKTKFLDEGIRYDDLSPEDKARYEEDFAEDDGMPDWIPPQALNKYVFNLDTIDMVVQDVREHGIKTAGGDVLGKTIIFAQNKKHAELIVQRFNALYPGDGGRLARRVVCDDAYVQKLIDDFKKPESDLRVAVSVDMLDTGIDVPSCVNLVFFKRVMSKTKFWQMIGRGTRLCPGLGFTDGTGEYEDKKYFYIFDYCVNFQYFRENKDGLEAAGALTLSESIFRKKVRLIAALQESEFAAPEYREWRTALAGECHDQVCALNDGLALVKMRRQFVEKYKRIESFTALGDLEKKELCDQIAPLVVFSDTDEAAKRFDSLMYGLMLDFLEGRPGFNARRSQLRGAAGILQKKTTIPQVAERAGRIKEVLSDEYWSAPSLMNFETTRRELRGLMKFLDGGEKRVIVTTNLDDTEKERKKDEPLAPEMNLEDYKERVNRYIIGNQSKIFIYRLTHNEPLTEQDYRELEKVLTTELGNKKDYAEAYNDTPFGLLVRQIAKLDHQAAMDAFAKFINDESLNSEQAAFVQRVIEYVEQNGWVEPSELSKAPLSEGVNFIDLFDTEQSGELIGAITAVKNNALYLEA